MQEIISSLSRNPKSTIGEYAKRNPKLWYDEMGKNYMMGRNLEDQERLMSWLLECGVRDAETLSVGSGPAPQEIFLASTGIIKKQITAIDISVPQLRIGQDAALEKGIKNISFVKIAAEDLDYENAFGQVFVLDSLHWTEDWRTCLKKVIKATKDKGVIFISHAKPPSAVFIHDFELSKQLISLGADVVSMSVTDPNETLPRTYIMARKEAPAKDKLLVASGSFKL